MELCLAFETLQRPRIAFSAAYCCRRWTDPSCGSQKQKFIHDVSTHVTFHANEAKAMPCARKIIATVFGTTKVCFLWIFVTLENKCWVLLWYTCEVRADYFLPCQGVIVLNDNVRPYTVVYYRLATVQVLMIVFPFVRHKTESCNKAPNYKINKIYTMDEYRLCRKGHWCQIVIYYYKLHHVADASSAHCQITVMT